MPTIRIESILGGHAPLRYFPNEGQFTNSIGIDPNQPISDSDYYHSSGLLRPAPSEKFSGGILSASPMWIIPNPKTDTSYVYDSAGEVYSVNNALSAVTAVSALGVAGGNGAAYYDNYIYFAKHVELARFGPLNGSPSWNTEWWDSAISATALSSATYPASVQSGLTYPNHPMHRHSDDKLYFGDVSASNQGILNYIKTTRTSVEGDTNSTSVYGALDFDNGSWPTAIATYGTDLAVALYEGSNSVYINQSRAKVAFWDTSSSSYSKIIDVEFPDSIITAMLNVNGALYVWSGQVGQRGCRVSKFAGGHTFEEIVYIDDGEPPFQGAISHKGGLISWGSYCMNPTEAACVWTLGTHKGLGLGKSVFNTMRSTADGTAPMVTSLSIIQSNDGGFSDAPIIGWKGTTYGLDKQGTTYNGANQVWRSAIYRIGKPFKIMKIRLPLAQAMAANMTITPKIYVDDESTSTTLTVINNTNYAASERNIVIKPVTVVGKHDFFLELTWSGSALCVVGLPIEIEYEEMQD